MDDDFKKAMAYSAASLQLQIGTLATLISNGTFGLKDALDALAVAKIMLGRNSELPQDVKDFATAQLDGAAASIQTIH